MVVGANESSVENCDPNLLEPRDSALGNSVAKQPIESSLDSPGWVPGEEQSHRRRISGTRVQSLVQAFETMISLAEMESGIRKIGDSKRKIGSCLLDEEHECRSSCGDADETAIGNERFCRSQEEVRDDVPSEKLASAVEDHGQTDDEDLSSCESYEVHRKSSKVTCLQPFTLRTEARGAKREYDFRKKLQKMLEEDSKLRIPIAQGLPWTTDEPEVVPKPPPRENTVPMEIRLCTQYRSVRRSQFDQYIATKLMYIEQQRQEQQRLQELAEREEIKRLRKEMVPRAQLMPYFDRPFVPQRSMKPLTVAKEPTFHCSHSHDHKRAKCCMVSQVNG